MNKYDEIKQIIEEAGDNVEFADFGKGVSEEWINKAEKRLNLTLPDSYKWWLKNYGGGEIYGDEIFSIYEKDFDSVVGGDIVYMHELNKRQFNYNDNMLVICETDNDVYYFDTSVKNCGNEYPVYALNQKCLYAENFIEFLKKHITEN